VSLGVNALECISRVLEVFSSAPRLGLARLRRTGLFYDLSAGEFCPLPIPPTSRGLRFPPLINREKDGGLLLGRAFDPSSGRGLVAGHQSLRKDLKAALYLQVPRA
jgi:hypothetical protein